MCALLARVFAGDGLRTLAVDCDPNPTLGEELGIASISLSRFGRDALRRAGETLELAAEPDLLEVEPRLWLLAGPPSATPLADAVARGVAGILVAHRFDRVVTDLGAGPEFARMAVGGVLNPADVCVVLTDGSPVGDLTAERVEAACAERAVPTLRTLNRRGAPEDVVRGLAEALL